MWYQISEPNAYLVITGANIQKVKIAKKAFIYPWQKCAKISISPFDFSLSLQAMTIEKLQFSLPAVFTIGPEDKMESLMKYAMLLTGRADQGTRTATTPTGRNHVQDIVKGIIEGETRVIVSSMSMEEIFKERQIFKQKVIANVQSELDQFGLRIYNANVKELQDTPGSEYFAYLSRKAHEGALNQAKIDVAEARMKGHIGEAEKQGKTKQEISKIDADTAVLETQRKSEKAEADARLATTQTELDMGINLTKIKARRAAESRDAELQREVESKRADMELERLRATEVVQSKIARESAQQVADASYYTQMRSADAKAYLTRNDAEANYFRVTKDAEAAFYSKQKEAEGMMEMAKAYGQLSEVLGGPQGLMQYMMLQHNTYEKLAKANATAINGLQPKITVWNTGAQNGEGSSADPTAPIRNLFQSLPPLLSTINEQTGISPPSWIAQMQNQERAMTTEKSTKVNGRT